MADLTTNYLGLKLNSPLIAAPASITGTVDRMKRCEENGIGAVVVKSLFENKLTRRAPAPRFKLLHHQLGRRKVFSLYSYEQASKFNLNRYAQEIERARKELNIPVIGSINCLTDRGWVSYAKALENSGADAIELNLSCPHSSVAFRGEEVEKRIVSITELVRKNVKLPIVPKLTPQLTSPLEVAKSLERVGASAIVIFNRFTGLDVDIETRRPVMHGTYAGYGGPWAITYGLRWASRIYREVKIPLSASGGVSSSEDVVKYILCGAQTVQICTAIIMDGYRIIKKLNKGLEKYLDEKGYRNFDDLRGQATKNILTEEEVDRRQSRVAQIDMSECTGCAICQRVCIYLAVDRKGDEYSITSACEGCGLCLELCPSKAIRMVKR